MTAHELARKLLEGPDDPVVYQNPDTTWWRRVENLQATEMTDRWKDGTLRQRYTFDDSEDDLGPTVSVIALNYEEI